MAKPSDTNIDPPGWKTSPFLNLSHKHHLLLNSSVQAGVGLTQCSWISHQALPIHAGDRAALSSHRDLQSRDENGVFICATWPIHPHSWSLLLSVGQLRPTKHQQSHSSYMNVVPVPCEHRAQKRVNSGAVGRDGDSLCQAKFSKLYNNFWELDIQKGPTTSTRKTRLFLAPSWGPAPPSNHWQLKIGVVLLAFLVAFFFF